MIVPVPENGVTLVVTLVSASRSSNSIGPAGALLLDEDELELDDDEDELLELLGADVLLLLDDDEDELELDELLLDDEDDGA